MLENHIYKRLKNNLDRFNIEIRENFVGETTYIWHLRDGIIILPAGHLCTEYKILLLIQELYKKINIIKLFKKTETKTIIQDYIIRYLTTGVEPVKYKRKRLLCDICGKEIKYKRHTPLIKICKECLYSQVRHDIEYQNCHLKNMSKPCLDCPSKIYSNCVIVKNNIQKKLIEKVKTSYNKRILYTNMNTKKTEPFSKIPFRF